jgi:hypothetical protein
VTAAEVLSERAKHSCDGSLWLAHLDGDGNVVLVEMLQEKVEPAPDELFLRHIVDQIGRLALPGVAVAVTRKDGKVQRVDRRLRRELSRRLAETTTALVAVFVVGESASRAITSAGPQPVDGRQRRHPPRPGGADRPGPHRQQQDAEANRRPDR